MVKEHETIKQLTEALHGLLTVEDTTGRRICIKRALTENIVTARCARRSIPIKPVVGLAWPRMHCATCNEVSELM